MPEPNDTSGAPRNSNLPPTILGAAPGGTSHRDEPTTPAPRRRLYLRFLLEIIKKPSEKARRL